MKPIPALSSEEVQSLVDYVSKNHSTQKKQIRARRNITIILLMLEAGLRVGEAVQLRVSDLFFDRQPVTWLRLQAEITKTKAERSIPASPSLRSAIASLADTYWRYYGLADNDYAFAAQKKSKHITVRQVQHIIEDASLRAIKRRIRPHILRHTFATRMMKKTNMRTVQMLLGHKDISSTQIYTHPNDNDLVQAIGASSTS